MACETCGHTMHRLGCQMTECGGTYFCPRCGTLKVEGTIVVPALVERCRKFEKNHLAEHTVSAKDFRAWTGLGIAESINTPDNRRPT